MIGKELRQLRKSLGLTLEELASEVGLSRVWMNLMEIRQDGNAPLPDATETQILEALGTLSLKVDEQVGSAVREIIRRERQRQLSKVEPVGKEALRGPQTHEE